MIPGQGSSASHAARKIKKYNCPGTSLVIQWFRLGAVTAGARVQSLVGELSHKPHGATKKKKKKEYGCPP